MGASLAWLVISVAAGSLKHKTRSVQRVQYEQKGSDSAIPRSR